MTSSGEPTSTQLVISSKNITNMVGVISLLGTHAEEGLLMLDENVHYMSAIIVSNNLPVVDVKLTCR